jgi:CRP-like cAMP-binding protein
LDVTAVETLAKCPLFEKFSENGVRILAGIASERSFPNDTPIFVESMIGDALYVVQQGMVRICVKDAEGADKVLTVLGEGEHFGELSLLNPGMPRMVTAVAEGNVKVLELRQRDFAALQREKPQACIKLMLAITAAFGKNVGASREALRSLVTGPAR